MRPGEVCALHWEEIDFDRRFVTVKQSAWHGQLQTPKTDAGVRVFSISSQLCEHLRQRRGTGLIFMYQNGRPWKGEKVVEYKLKPLLRQLGIEKPAKRVGLYAFRHFNGSMMDQLGTPVKVRQDPSGAY